MKLFDKITKHPVYYSIFYSFIVLAISSITAVSAMNAEVTSEIDLRFIGPVALFLMVLSIVFTLFPFTALRAKAFGEFYKSGKNFAKSAPKAFMILESMITVFMLLSYMGAMSGSMWGGVGLVLLSALNFIGIIIAGIAVATGFGMNRYSDASVRYKAESLNAHATIQGNLANSSENHNSFNFKGERI